MARIRESMGGCTGGGSQMKEEVPICDGCGKPWVGPAKNDRCWCDPSPSYHYEEIEVPEEDPK